MENCTECGAPDTRAVVSMDEFANRVGLKLRTVRYHLDRGLPCVRRGRKRCIPVDEGVEFVEQRRLRRQPKRRWYHNRLDHRPGIIYALRCPKTNRVRYIGKTGVSLADRFSGHLCEARKGNHRPVCRWIRKLLRQGLKPIPEVLQECLPGMLDASEQEWIAQFRADGAKLLNATDGGEATAWNVDAKQRQSERCLEINRRLAKDPKWLEAQHRRWAANKGMTLEQYREWRANRPTTGKRPIEQRLLAKYNALLGRVRRQRREQAKEARQIRIEGDIAYVPLTRGQTAIIDVEDVPKVSQHKWSASTHNGGFRAKTNLPGKQATLLNRFVVNATDREMVCFRDDDMLNCRKGNLMVMRKGGPTHIMKDYEKSVRLYARVA